MFKKCLAMFLTTMFVLNAEKIETIRLVDFSAYESIATQESWPLGQEAFNSAPEIIPFFALLQKNYNIDIAIETGTFKGQTTKLFASLFKEVHTIELKEEMYREAKPKLGQFSNIQCHLGDSAVVLNYLLPPLKDRRILFYLDAHWYNFWPLLDELDTIAKNHKDNCIIVIDDFKVPTRPEIPYDIYGNHECSFEYIKEKLDSVFTDYEYCFVIPKNYLYAAKFVAFPKQWGIENLQAEGYFD